MKDIEIIVEYGQKDLKELLSEYLKDIFVEILSKE